MSRWSAIGLLVLGVLVLLPAVPSPYVIGLITKALLLAIFAMSLNILLGYTGLPSFGHAAPFGTGGYTVALLVKRLGWDPWLALPAGATAAVLVSAVLGVLSLRAEGVYFLMITLALAQVLWGIAFDWRSLTGGDDGLPGIPRPALWGHWTLTDPTAFYWVALGAFLLTLFCLSRMLRSPFGYALMGIRENELRMNVLAYNTKHLKYLAFLIAGGVAGFAGALFTYYNGYVSPSALNVSTSAEVSLMVLVGGPGTLVGPAAGAGAVVLLESLVGTYTKRWLMVLGVVYVLTAIVARRGLARVIRPEGPQAVSEGEGANA